MSETMKPSVPSHVISFTEEQKVEIVSRIRGVLDSGQVVLGCYTEEFEAEYAARLGRRYAVAMSSDTAAFEALLKIVGVEDKVVLFPALGFVSLMESIANAGAEAWLFDCDLEKHLFPTANALWARLAEVSLVDDFEVGALILMHTGGLIAADSAAIEELFAANGIPVLEDAAHAFGATLDDRAAGSFGVASAFSLYATKPMHACEGGMIVTDDGAIARRARIMRNYGRVADFGRSIAIERGSSWRMTEIQAVIGLSNLRRIDNDLEQRRIVMDRYDWAIGGHPFLGEFATRLPMSSGMSPNGYRYLMVVRDEKVLSPGRQRWRTELKAHLLEAYGLALPGEVYELPIHQQPTWAYRYPAVRFPEAERFCSQHFSLPVYRDLLSTRYPAPEEIVDMVAAGLKRVLG